MCGIWGYVKNWKTSGFHGGEQKLVYQLMHAGCVRGWDATGVIAVGKDQHFEIAKAAVHGTRFMSSFIDSPMDKMLWDKGVAVIGHNRAKTIGENKDENAHPFVEDKTFAMVHNGTLRNHKKQHDTEVDSHALTIMFKQAMDQDDWKTAMEEAVGKVEGAFACVWYDQKRDLVCMIRNNERPMALVSTSAGTIFGSELEMLRWIAGRNNEKIQKEYILPVHTLLSFDMKKTGGEFSETNLSPKFPAKVTKGFTNGTGIVGPWQITETNLEEKFTTVSTETGAAPLSKQQFKQLRSLVFGKYIDFWIEDYAEVETDPQTNKCTRALLMGVSLSGRYDLVDHKHIIKAYVDLKKLHLDEEDLYGALQLQGKCYNMEFDKDNKQAVLRLDNVFVANTH